MRYPKISIVTPSLNQGQYIEQTILSVLEQNYPNIEYTIIDGGSTDNTVEVIKKYEKHLNYWVSEKDKGQSDAINKGIKKSSGEIFNWINSDDYYEKNALFTIAEIFSDPQINVVCGKSRVFKNTNELIRYSGTAVDKTNLAKAIGQARIGQPETFFRKSCLDKIGFLSTDLNYVMDIEWFIKYLSIFGTASIINTSEVLVNFRHHDTSKTCNEGDKFKVERDLIYYSIASQLHLPKQAATIARLTTIDKKYRFEIANFNSELLKSAINYFLLLRGDEFYFSNNKYEAKNCFKLIDQSRLDEQNRKHLNKLIFRNDYLPIWLIKLFRR